MWRQNFRAMLGKQRLPSQVMAGDMLAEYNMKIAWVHCKRAQIEYLVMKRTKGQSVVLNIQPARLEPLDMRSYPTR